ncbi:MAG: prepilin-type N-terminal cleavage/methylation domain-containing protein [Betaproteobacteria bacterium]|nr:MAG: prepilin-type N-terminal cleavage/methylation domain-containing protein [Betaproteobacteria bacterium]
MKQSGSTLLELMVVLSVSAILLGIAIPGFSALTSNSRLVAATNELVSSLHLARSEAIKRNSRVVLCTSATGTSCVASGGWHQGWLVFHDPNNNAVLDSGETVILARQSFPAGLKLNGNQWIAKYISYTPSGATRTISGVLQVGTLTVCNESAASGTARWIVVSSTGRPRTVKVVLASCPLTQ